MTNVSFHEKMEQSPIKTLEYPNFPVVISGNDGDNTRLGLIRGASEDYVFNPDVDGHIKSFVGSVEDILAGTQKEGAIIAQLDAHGEHDEQARDEIVHGIGKILHSDVEGSLNASEYVKDVPLAPFFKKLFNLDNPDEPSIVRATVREASFSSLDSPEKSLLLQELEFDNNLISSEGVTERKHRMIGLYLVGDNDMDKKSALPDTE